METTILHPGIILWSILVAIHLFLSIVAVIKLANFPLPYTSKFLMLIGIFVVPLFGPVMFFAFRKREKANLKLNV